VKADGGSPTRFPRIARRFCVNTPDPFTIPGLRVPVWFTPTKTGRYQINYAQLCGNGHSAMSGGFLTVESQADFDKWLKSKSGATTSFE
jgi:heme/copper-type cytochrome/quinol oxidase subunit 2